MTVEPFMRTPSGLANYDLFLYVEVIAYCEGEQADINCIGEYDTIDLMFWSTTLNRLLGGRTFKLVPVGPKTTVVRCVQDALSANPDASGRIFGCIDRDYDDLFPISHAPWGCNVLSSHGYSVENDILNWVGTAEIVRICFPRLKSRHRNLIVDWTERLVRSFGSLAKIDRALNKLEVALVPKNGVLSIVERMTVGDITVRPVLSRDFIELKRTVLARQNVRSFHELKARCSRTNIVPPERVISGVMDFPGKSLIKSLICLFSKIGARLPKWGSLGYERFIDILLLKYADLPEPISKLIDSNPRALSWRNRR